MGERFKVATVDGYATDKGGHRSGPAGLTAHVLDTAYCHNVGASFRSEDLPVSRAEVARGWTVGRAQVHAETLNAAERSAA